MKPVILDNGEPCQCNVCNEERNCPTVVVSWVEAGSWKKGGQGSRNDLSAVKETIDAGATRFQIMNSHFSESAKYMRFFDDYRMTRDKELTLKHPGTGLNIWQCKVLDILNNIIDNKIMRKVISIIGPKGGEGKSDFIRYLTDHQQCNMFMNGKNGDLAMIYDPKAKCYAFEITRSNQDTLNYSIIEQIANGIVYSPKYEVQMKCADYDKPNPVLIFSNWVLDFEQLSADRWIVVVLNGTNDEPTIYKDMKSDELMLLKEDLMWTRPHNDDATGLLHHLVPGISLKKK